MRTSVASTARPAVVATWSGVSPGSLLVITGHSDWAYVVITDRAKLIPDPANQLRADVGAAEPYHRDPARGLARPRLVQDALDHDRDPADVGHSRERYQADGLLGVEPVDDDEGAAGGERAEDDAHRTADVMEGHAVEHPLPRRPGL